MTVSNDIGMLRSRYSLSESVLMMQEAGFDAVDISMFNIAQAPFSQDSEEEIAALVKIREQNGIGFVQAHAPFGGGIERYTKELVPLFPHAFALCQRLGIPNMVIHPLQTGRYYGNEDKLYELNMRFYSSLAPLARQNGVKIAIENMWQRHPVTGVIVDDVCAPPEELVRYYDGLNDPETFTVCLDIGHVALCGREPEDAIRTIGADRLGCLHVHDNDYRADLHVLPCTGRINWDNVCRALGEIGYKGAFNMECSEFLANFPHEHYPTVLRFMADTARVLSRKIELYTK